MKRGATIRARHYKAMVQPGVKAWCCAAGMTLFIVGAAQFYRLSTISTEQLVRDSSFMNTLLNLISLVMLGFSVLPAANCWRTEAPEAGGLFHHGQPIARKELGRERLWAGARLSGPLLFVSAILFVLLPELMPDFSTTTASSVHPLSIDALSAHGLMMLFTVTIFGVGSAAANFSRRGALFPAVLWGLGAFSFLCLLMMAYSFFAGPFTKNNGYVSWQSLNQAKVAMHAQTVMQVLVALTIIIAVVAGAWHHWLQSEPGLQGVEPRITAASLPLDAQLPESARRRRAHRPLAALWQSRWKSLPRLPIKIAFAIMPVWVVASILHDQLLGNLGSLTALVQALCMLGFAFSYLILAAHAVLVLPQQSTGSSGQIAFPEQIQPTSKIATVGTSYLLLFTIAAGATCMVSLCALTLQTYLACFGNQ